MRSTPTLSRIDQRRFVLRELVSSSPSSAVRGYESGPENVKNTYPFDSMYHQLSTGPSVSVTVPPSLRLKWTTLGPCRRPPRHRRKVDFNNFPYE